MPPEEFVREYDKLAREMILGCGNPLAFASVTNLLLPVLHQGGPETLQVPDFDPGLYRNVYRMFVENSERFLTGLDSMAFTPEERGMVSRGWRNLSTLKRYDYVFMGRSPTRAEALMVYRQMGIFMSELERDLGSVLGNYR